MMQRSKNLDKKLRELTESRELTNQERLLEQDKFRAQSYSVGKIGPGSTELSMRGVDGNYLFTMLHPADVVELIHQLSANIGCHLAIQPRQDFASYREWKELTETDYERLNGWTPHPQVDASHAVLGKGALSLDRPFKWQNQQTKEQLKEELRQELLADMSTETEENAVAIKKTVKRKSVKRPRKTAK